MKNRTRRNILNILETYRTIYIKILCYIENNQPSKNLKYNDIIKKVKISYPSFNEENYSFDNIINNITEKLQILNEEKNDLVYHKKIQYNSVKFIRKSNYLDSWIEPYEIYDYYIKFYSNLVKFLNNKFKNITFTHDLIIDDLYQYDIIFWI